MSSLIRSPAPAIRCQAVVDLMSRVQRPYQFRVTVTGQDWPFQVSKVYDIAANTDEFAAREGIRLFCEAMSRPQPMLEIVTP
jgi:hypothetical protein